MLIHTTMQWHNVTLTGNDLFALFQKKTNASIYAGHILNCLSHDMEVLDSSLSNSLCVVLFQLATFITWGFVLKNADAQLTIYSSIYPAYMIHSLRDCTASKHW